MTQAKHGPTSTRETAQLAPVLDDDPLNLVVSLSTIVHWADNDTSRRAVMAAIEFAVDDVPMYHVVYQLAYRGAMRPTDLAQVLATGRANLTKIAHRLTEAGLAVRVPDPDDARSVLIALTPLGRDFGRRIITLGEEWFSDFLADWSDDEVMTLKRVFARFARQATAQTMSTGRLRAMAFAGRP